MINFTRSTKAVSSIFIFNGALFGAWASRIPSIKQQFDISHQELSILLLLLAAGAIASFPMAGKLTDSLGASRLSKLTFWLYALAFIFIGFSPNIILLGFAVFFFGSIHGAMDVAMNSWASDIEAQNNKVIMPFFHAMFSFGAGIGAASGALMSWFDVTPNYHFVIFIIFMWPCYFWVKKGLVTKIKSSDDKQQTAGFKFPKGSLFIVALIAFSCAIGEGAMADWTAVYMSQEVNSSHSEAAIAYTIFSLFMVLTRLAGSQLINRFGVVPTVKVCALSSFIGALIVIMATTVLISYLGFALLGIGYSIVIPLAFSRAANVNNVSTGSAIAGVATFAYGGMLLGPVVIGLLADMLSLRIAFILFLVLSVYVFFAAKILNKQENKLNRVTEVVDNL